MHGLEICVLFLTTICPVSLSQMFTATTVAMPKTFFLFFSLARQRGFVYTRTGRDNDRLSQLFFSLHRRRRRVGERPTADESPVQLGSRRTLPHTPTLLFPKEKQHEQQRATTLCVMAGVHRHKTGRGESCCGISLPSARALLRMDHFFSLSFFLFFPARSGAYHPGIIGGILPPIADLEFCSPPQK